MLPSRSIFVRLYSAALALSFATLIVACSSEFGERIKSGHLTVYVKPPVDRKTGEQLIEYLKPYGWTQGENKTVQILKEGEAYAVNVVMKPGAENDIEIIRAMEFLAHQLSTDVLNSAKVKLRLCDATFTPLKEFSSTDLYLIRNGTLMIWLKKPLLPEVGAPLEAYYVQAGWNQASNRMVVLEAEKQGYKLIFPVKEGMETNEKFVGAVRRMREEIATQVYPDKPLIIEMTDMQLKPLLTIREE